MNRTKLNKKVNKELKELFEYMNIYSCEAKLGGCNDGWLTFAHRHKRNWYIGREDLLTKKNQVILACIKCHMKIEKDKRLTEKVFMRLRGKEYNTESNVKTKPV